MTTSDPISLAQTKRLAANADTILLRATRPADLETPIGAFLRLDDGGPAYLLESVEGGERLGRYSFLGVGPRRLLEVRDGHRQHPDPTSHGPDLRPGPAGRDRRRRRIRSAAIRAFVAAPPRPADRGHAALHGWRRRGAGVRRRQHLRAARPAPRARPRRRPDGGVHRDRPRPRLRPPDPHAVGDRLAAHRDPRPRRPLPHRRGGHLRGARADAPARARPSCAWPRAGARRPSATPARRPDRHQPRPRRVHPRGRGRQGRDRQRRGDPGRARPTPVVRPARSTRRRAPTLDGIGLYRALRRVNPSPYLFFVRTPTLRGRRRVARSCSSRSRATSSRPTRSPGPGRAARTPARTRSWPSSSSAIPRSAPST